MNVSDRVAEGVALALLAAAFAFGGGSRGAGDLVVHLLALAALPLAMVRAGAHPPVGPQRWIQLWFAFAAGLLVLQLLPLPSGLWQRLPLRADLAPDLTAAGVPTGWQPLTLDTWGTVRGLLWLVTAYTAWCLIGTLPPEAQVRWLKVAVVLGVAMALLGFSQAAAGRQPTLRFHPFHNEFGASGTFANRNHFGALMAMLAPLAVGLGRVGLARRHPAAFSWYLAAVVLVLAAALSFSRAGFLLAALASSVAVVGAWRWGAPEVAAARKVRHGLPLAGAAVLAIVGVATYAWTQLAARLDKDPLDDLRMQYLQHGFSAVKAYLTWGTGVGGFRWAYAPFEAPRDMGETYALHAHNDLLEVALETGWLGLLLLAVLLAVLAAAVRQSLGPKASPHALLMIATVIAITVPLLHSLVDYPLRTLSVLLLFSGLIAQLGARKSLQPKTAKPLA